MSIAAQNQKIALVHDWLMGIGGAEKTLKELHGIFPEAPIYTLFYDKKFVKDFLPDAKIVPSFLQKFCGSRIGRKFFAPLMPTAIESFDLSEFDLVISSSVIFSKGLILKPKTKHICYCYSPTRQIWDWQAEYRNERKLPQIIISLFQHFLRIWDRNASTRVDKFIAVSENVRKRIQKYYGRDSEVIYPPVNAPKLNDGQSLAIGDYFLIASRLFKHKNVEIAVKTFNKLEWPLIIIGDGPERKHLQKIAGPTVKIIGWQNDENLANYYSNCSGFILPQEEDFGITPIEAMFCGKPTLALRHGGALEYIQEGINGEFFEDPVPEVLADGVRRLKEGIDRGKYSKSEIKKSAEKFSAERFVEEIKKTLISNEYLARTS